MKELVSTASLLSYVAATYSTSRKGKVTVFQKSYPYSQVIYKHRSENSEIFKTSCNLKMLVPFLLYQRVVLDSDRVPHVIFLKIIILLSKLSENLLVITVLPLSDIESKNLPVSVYAKYFYF